MNQQQSILRDFIAHYEKAHDAAHLQMFVSCLGPLADRRIEENINQGGLLVEWSFAPMASIRFAEFDHRVNPTSVLITCLL